jgi:hypothetical protein
MGSAFFLKTGSGKVYIFRTSFIAKRIVFYSEKLY